VAAIRRTAALSGVGERAQHAVLGGGPGAGPVGAQHVVGVLAVGDRVEPVALPHLVGDAREQLVLAVVAAVRPVGPVGGPLALVGDDLDHRHADDPGDGVRRAALVVGEAGRHPDDAEHAVGAQRPDRQREQRRRVDAPGEGDAEPAQARQPGGHPLHRVLVRAELHTASASRAAGPR
jgi:hypothetical protein